MILFLEDLVKKKSVTDMEGWPIFRLRWYTKYQAVDFTRTRHKKPDDPKWRSRVFNKYRLCGV